jgi:hypothetical protein
LKNRSENLAGRGQILTILPGNSHSIAQKSGEIWTGQANLQPISFKSDRLLAFKNQHHVCKKNQKMNAPVQYRGPAVGKRDHAQEQR